MIIVVKSGAFKQDDVCEERDVCDWLNANPNVKAVLDGVLMKYIDDANAHPNFPTDVIHAVSRVTVAIAALWRAADDVYDYDNIVSRARLHVAAEKVGAIAIRLLMEIGNLKGREKNE